MSFGKMECQRFRGGMNTTHGVVHSNKQMKPL